MTPDDWIPADRLRSEVEAIVADSPLADGMTIKTLTTGVTPNAPSVTAELVASRAACGWVSQWVEAKASGNAAQTDEAAAAMSAWSRSVSDRHPDSAWTASFVQFAQAMAADGELNGDVMLSVRGVYSDAFGCA